MIVLKGGAALERFCTVRWALLPCHVFLPILFVGDWFLFRERGKVKWHYPFASAGFPLAYMTFIFIQAVILKFDTSILIPGTNTPLIYPYFFVNLETQGVAGIPYGKNPLEIKNGKTN